MQVGLRWVSCPPEVSFSGSMTRHLILSGSPTTLCGKTASQPGVWRANLTKPECATCLKRNSEGQNNTAIPAKTPAEKEESTTAPVSTETTHHCKHCGAVIEYGQPLYQGHDYWFHVHNHSSFCTLPPVAMPE